MRDDNKKNEKLLKSVYKGDKSKYIDPVGDEYYNLDINNQDIRLPQFTEFQTAKDVKISTIKKRYNLNCTPKVRQKNLTFGVFLL